MKKILAGAVGAAAALAVIFGAGPAGAINEYNGFTYAQVKERTGRTVVVASRVGSYLPTEECVVTGSRLQSGSEKLLLDLNCNDASALNGHPGNSVAKPEGKAIQLAKDRAVRFSNNYQQSLEQGKTPACLQDAGSVRFCIDVCTKSESCSAELSEALGL